MALTKKRRIFIEEYLKCWNATEAARRAEYAHPRRQGSRLLTFVDIKDVIEQRLAEAAMEANEVLARLSEQARCAYAEYINEKGEVDLIAMKRDDRMYLIAGVKETNYGKQIQFHDGQHALIKIGEYHNLFKQGIELSGGPLVIQYTGNVNPEDV